jgi:DNA-directed RNA polymerase beta subunit
MHRLIKSGKAQRREYYYLNRSDLFSPLPQGNFAQEQKKSYGHFLQKSLPDLLQLYFPIQLQDYNSQVKLEVLKYENKYKYFRIEEPEISPEEARQKKITWNQKLFLKLLIK